MNNFKVVEIPSCDDHWGRSSIKVKLKWICPVCGGIRGKIFDEFSWDGRYKLKCDGWKNPCGHVDLYKDCREEAKNNGLNKEVFLNATRIL